VSSGPEGTRPAGEPHSQEVSAMLWLAMGLARGVLADASPMPTPEACMRSPLGTATPGLEDGDVLVRARLAVNLAAGVAVGVPAGLGWKGSLLEKPPMGRSNCPPPLVLVRPWLLVGLSNGALRPARPCLFVGLASGVLRPFGTGSRCEASPTAAALKAAGLAGAVAASTGHGWHG